MSKVCKPTFPLRIAVEAPSLPTQEAQHLIRTTQHALDDLNDFAAHHLRLVLQEKPVNAPERKAGATGQERAESTRNKDDIALTVRLLPGENGLTPRSELHSYAPVIDIVYAPNQIPSSSSSVSPLATYIATELQSIYAEEQASLAFLMATTPWGSSHSKPLTMEQGLTLEKRKTRSFKYSPTYHLTLSLFTPGTSPSDWDIEGALGEYLQPLLTSLSSISNFTVDSQVQLYATFSPSMPGPIYSGETGTWLLRKSDLSSFINAAEWPLSPSIGEGPTINFILYFPGKDQTPLAIEDNGGTSWLVPQWGGVQILNLPGATLPSALTKDHLQSAMQTFSNQLQALLGLPASPQSLPLRISTLTRAHAASLIYSASSTLGALARLTQTLPSIAIPDGVSQSVQTTISHLTLACNALRDGRFHSALENARIAENAAERAFFDRSMVGQVYFPDEHKVAVYLPLLGPVAVPLIMAAVKELKTLRKRE
jgi:GPI-anchor transamidase subunit S